MRVLDVQVNLSKSDDEWRSENSLNLYNYVTVPSEFSGSYVFYNVVEARDTYFSIDGFKVIC